MSLKRTFEQHQCIYIRTINKKTYALGLICKLQMSPLEVAIEE